jgi:hypothetical protein
MPLQQRKFLSGWRLSKGSVFLQASGVNAALRHAFFRRPRQLTCLNQPCPRLVSRCLHGAGELKFVHLRDNSDDRPLSRPCEIAPP